MARSWRDGDPLVIKLPRTPGRKDSEYMHLFCGPVDIEAYLSNVQAAAGSSSSARSSVAELEQRISVLEEAVADLKKLLE